MYKKILALSVLFISITEVVLADDKIGVVDLQQLVSNSQQVKQLKKEHSQKMEELERIIINARGEISNQKDPEKILMLEEKYTNEFNTKKDLIDKEYNSKLLQIEKNIKDEISKKAKSEDYDFVFAKSVVLYGGDDITSQIQNLIK